MAITSEMLPPSILFLTLTMMAMASSSSSTPFMTEIEWKCSASLIDILVHTRKPFFGLVHPREGGGRHSNCTFAGNGRHMTRLRIPLLDGGNGWRDCGLHLEEASSTLWTQLEVHEHAQLVMGHDRLVNVSCAGWVDSLNRGEGGGGDGGGNNNRQFRLIFRPANPTSAEQMSPTSRLLLGAPYDLLLFGPPGQQVRVHSCGASPAIDNDDGSGARVELIDADGCPLPDDDGPSLMSQFRPLTAPPSSSSSPPPPPLLPSSTNSSSPSPNSPPPPAPSWPHRVAVATARIPSMFRFNSALTKAPTDELVRFECSVEPCGGEGQAPCRPPQFKCGENRQTRQQKESEAMAMDQAVPAEGGELELVTQLLGSDESIDGGGDGAAKGNGNNSEGIVGSATTEEGGGMTTLVPSAQQNGTTTTENAVTSPPLVKARNASNGLGGWHRVRTMVRVLDNTGGNRSGKDGGTTRDTGGWVNSQGTAAAGGKRKNGTGIVQSPPLSDGTSSSDATTDEPPPTTNTDAPLPPSILPNSRQRIRLINPSAASPPLLRDFIAPITTTIPSSPSNASASSAPLVVLARPSSSSSASIFSSSPPPSPACVSPEQLLRLYQICIGLCALFLLGCFCNFLLCCFNRRRSSKLHSPLRGKRGRRQQSVLISNGPPSNATLTSSLYGPGNNVAMANGTAAQKKEKGSNGTKEHNGFWISAEEGGGGENGCGGAGGEIESDHFGPMLSSIYGALSVQPPGPSSSNRRSSIHSYASVKAPHSTQQRASHHQLLSAASSHLPSSHQQQGHELVQQSGSISPANSPSTTTSSSGGAGQLSRTFHPTQQQQQFGGQKQPQASSSLTSSSVRSSTLGTPSPTEPDGAIGASTPRPSSDLVVHQEDGQSQSSTFGRPMQAQQQQQPNFLTTSPPLIQQPTGLRCQQNESLSFL